MFCNCVAGFCKPFKLQETPSQESSLEAVPGVSNHAVIKSQAVDSEHATNPRPSDEFNSATAATATSSGAAVRGFLEWSSLEDSIVSSF